jgi:hypothetical protein
MLWNVWDGRSYVNVEAMVRLRHSERQLFLVVPLHKELKRGTLNGILKDARLSREELNSLLRRS